ncbi:MAG TPA: TetR/AcrR family transcriptional regulator [Bacillota bacterium]|nr:TetR/AcrR family transcriptional regulator [Bacillota bacterium]
MNSVTTVQRRPRRYLRSRITRKLILDTAMQIFLLEGYTKTTIARISEQANVGYGTVYSHFKGKDDILNRILDHVLSDLYNLLGSQPELSRPREYYNFFQKVMQTLFLLVEEHRPIMNVYGEALVHSEDIAAYWEELLQKFRFVIGRVGVYRLHRELPGPGPAEQLHPECQHPQKRPGLCPPSGPLYLGNRQGKGE